MALYAHIVADVIVELFTPPNGISINDCFHSALTWVDITGRNPQPEVGWTATSANGIWTIVPPIAPTLTPAQQAKNVLSTAVQIFSASQPSLSGVYPIDSDSRIIIIAEVVSISVNQAFTDGSTALQILDISNNTHEFDIPHFLSYAKEIGQFMTSLQMVAAGTSDTLPKQPVQII